MSYLRGPLTRAQIKLFQQAPLTAVVKDGASKAVSMASPAPPPPTAAVPVLPPDIRQVFVPASGDGPRYAPVVVGAAQIRFTDTKTKVDVSRDVIFATPITNDTVPVDWNRGERLNVDVGVGYLHSFRC